MRLGYIELSGFRGFRSRQRIDFGSGFTVISGRNGVGKSTVCDAIEFALTGEIGKYAIESAARETVRDYVWWRGEGACAAYYVTVCFENEDGESFVIHRTREGGSDKTDAQIVAALCHGAIPDEPLVQLAKTGIIRDEWIAALSLDLTETQRFELVRAALGAIEGGDLADRAKAVVEAANTHYKACDAHYEVCRSQLTAALVDKSSATEAAVGTADVAEALGILDTLIGAGGEEELAVRLDRARRELHPRRRRVDGMGEVMFEANEVAELQKSFHSDEAKAQRDIRAQRKEAAASINANAQVLLEQAERAFEIESRANDVARSLAFLVEHGEKLGRHDDACPLCASPQTDVQFLAGVELARTRIDALAEGMNIATREVAQARVAAAMAAEELATADAECARDIQALNYLRHKEEEEVERFGRLDVPFHLIGDLEGLERFVAQQRNEIIAIERALAVLEASQAVIRMASMDARAATYRHQVEVAGNELAAAESALSTAKSLEKNVRRSASEIVDERLALISPLLDELYQRLRPHADWRSIQYSIRGDLKRLLSLKVGNSLNPQFVFSSGQRRAAGLAFLLSVHLARSWARWETLVLDDPVQHIDDFRALHLVEVLAALRRDGRQIVCAVEDDALADLLCRRLASSHAQPGRRVMIDLGADSSGDVVAQSNIVPMSSRALSGSPHSLRTG